MHWTCGDSPRITKSPVDLDIIKCANKEIAGGLPRHSAHGTQHVPHTSCLHNKLALCAYIHPGRA